MASVIDLTSSPPPHASGSGEKKRARHVNDDVSNTLRMKVYGKPKAQKERDVNPASDAKTMYIDPSQRDKFAFAAQAKNCLPHGRWPQVLENTRAVKINIYDRPTIVKNKKMRLAIRQNSTKTKKTYFPTHVCIRNMRNIHNPKTGVNSRRTKQRTICHLFKRSKFCIK